MKYLLIILSLAFCTTAFAQAPPSKTASAVGEEIDKLPDGWTTGGTGSLTFNQVGLKNWSAGGDPSISFLLASNYDAKLRKGKHLWQNTISADYGIQKIKGDPFRKNSDRIEALSKYGLQVDKEGKWYVATLFNAKSQFSKTFSFDPDGNKTGVISRWASPITLEYSIGVDYVPNEYFSLYMSPLASKWIIVTNDSIALLNLHGNNSKNVNTQVGALAVASYKQEVYKNVTIGTTLKLYKDYLKGPAQNLDVDWQTNIGLKVNKYISANVFLHLIWDYDTDTDGATAGIQRSVQFKDVIGVGFSYSFQGKADAE